MRYVRETVMADAKLSDGLGLELWIGVERYRTSSEHGHDSACRPN